MKRLLSYCIVIISVLCFLTGCAHSPAENRKSEESLSEQGKNFRLYTVYEEERIYSRYEIFGADGEIITSGQCDGSRTMLRQISDDIVEIDVHIGTGMSDIQYCDVERKIISDIYNITHPVLAFDDIIVYGEEDGQKLKLTARDIFDAERYYEDFVIDSESYAKLTGLKAQKNSIIEVTYAEGINNGGSYQETEKTKVFNLKK